jgi:hypothetical protein
MLLSENRLVRVVAEADHGDLSNPHRGRSKIASRPEHFLGDL